MNSWTVFTQNTLLTSIRRIPFLRSATPCSVTTWRTIGNDAAFETFMRRLGWSRTCSRRALEASKSTDAVLEWQKVFGDAWFPNDVDTAHEQGKRLLAAAQNRNSIRRRLWQGHACPSRK